MEDVLRYLQERDARDEIQRILAERRYDNPRADDFALNPRTRRLGFGEDRARDDDDAKIVARRPLIVMAAIPQPPLRELFTTADDEIWDWLQEHGSGYQPLPKAQFLPGKAASFVDGVIFEDQRYVSSGEYRVVRYVAVERFGIVEMAVTERAYIPYKGHALYGLTYMVGLLWQFLGFVSSFNEEFDQQSGFKLVVGLRATDRAWLSGLGAGWVEPTDGWNDYRPTCMEPGLLISRDALPATMGDEVVASLVRDVATQIDNAWGQRSPRCYVHSKRDPEQKFAVESFRSFFQ